MLYFSSTNPIKLTENKLLDCTLTYISVVRDEWQNKNVHNSTHDNAVF